MQNKSKALFVLIVSSILTIPVLAKSAAIILESEDSRRLTALPNAISEVNSSVAEYSGEQTPPNQAQVVLNQIRLDLFGMAVGNKWIYEGTRQGQRVSVERKIISINQSSFPAPVFVNEVKENGIFAGIEYYEEKVNQLKLWGSSIKENGIIYDLKFSPGLVVAWTPLYVGEQRYSTATATIAQYPGYIFNTSLTVNVNGLETVSLDFGFFKAYKVNYTLILSGNNIFVSNNFTWWLLPYIGVVKETGSDSSSTLTNFSIGDGMISEASDTDTDGLTDIVELLVFETDWRNADTDGDGFDDDEEVTCGSDPIDVQSRCSYGLPWLMLLLGSNEGAN